MSIECRPSNLCSDVRCPCCGQGFLLYGDRTLLRERAAIRATVQDELRRQHGCSSHSPHAVRLDVSAAFAC